MTHEQAVWLIAGVFILRSAPDKELPPEDIDMTSEFIKAVMLEHDVTYSELVATDIETHPFMEEAQRFCQAKKI